VRRRLLCVVALVLLPFVLAAQNDASSLPRRGWFGVALAPHELGAAVTSVAPNSPAAADGMKAGDVIRAVDGTAVRSPADVIADTTRHAPGTTAVFDLLRAGEELRRSVVLRALPFETLPGVSFDYGSVTVSGGTRLRTIVTVPDRAAARSPAVMLIGGGGCGSIDSPLAADFGPAQLIRMIAAQGYVTIRVEKSGVGDSQGPPCREIGYTQELEGYQATLAALRRHPRVDPNRIVLLGISLGGVFAPVLAAQTPVRAIVAFGTISFPPSPYPGRSARFFSEFAGVDVAGAWSSIDARVLALHGQFEEDTSLTDHARIAAWVNAKRPGQAEARELSGLDHCWTLHATMEESKGHCGAGRQTSAVIDAVLDFLRANA
jgi:dienelactone hydrolase